MTPSKILVVLSAINFLLALAIFIAVIHNLPQKDIGGGGTNLVIVPNSMKFGKGDKIEIQAEGHGEFGEKMRHGRNDGRTED